MIKILIIEDDADISEMLRFFLEDQGYQVISADDGVAGVRAFYENTPDLVLLDVLLPKMNGYAVCELLKKEYDVPVIMISALGSEEDQLKGFEQPIDDYIPKPVSLPVMTKKIEAVLRRYGKQTRDREVYKYRQMTLDTDNYRVVVDSKVIDITKKECEILKELLSNQGRIITRESFLNRLWKYEFDVDERAVDNHIKNLRRKLGEAGKYIETVRGGGYRIDKVHS